MSDNSSFASEITSRLVADNQFFFSFEYFPPKTEKGLVNLKRRLHHMAKWGPQWMDVTWGAGGSTSELTPEICSYIQNDVGTTCMMHLTCTNMPREKIDIGLAVAKEANIRNILALRGDPPDGESEWKAIETGFSCALDLVKYIKSQHGDYFGITVAGYSEGHPNVRHPIAENEDASNYWAVRRCADGSLEGVTASDWESELDYLKAKQDAGAQVIVTQLFYDVDIFLGFVDAAREKGITIPIVPGIMPIRNAGSFGKMTGFCKTVIPDGLARGLDEVMDDSDRYMEVGMNWVVNMCKRLRDSGKVPSIHIYTMNSSPTSGMILRGLELSDAPDEPKAKKSAVVAPEPGQPQERKEEVKDEEETAKKAEKEKVTMNGTGKATEEDNESSGSSSTSDWLWIGVVLFAAVAVGVSLYRAQMAAEE